MKSPECWPGGTHVARERGAYKRDEADEADVRRYLLDGRKVLLIHGYQVPLFKLGEVVRWRFVN